MLESNICVKRENPTLFLFEEDRRYAIKEDWMFLLQNLRKNKIYIIDKVTITMRDHTSRSMRSESEKIIERTMLSKEWILKRCELSNEEADVLDAHINYFCGIHSYLENKKKQGVNYSIQAIRHGGLKLKYVLLLFKSLIGKKFIRRFQ